MAGDKPGPEQEVSDEELLRVLALAYKPALGTTEIADCVDLSRQAIDQRMKQLEEIRLVESGKFGSTRAWWLTDDGRRQVSDSELNDPSRQ
ncbi:winged helix-turn-helix domain-containing protein [Haloarcula sp. H-GB4]|uniref:winged helix-turn-helix domain-containing protein n=1 Tax=Haloarcula sp. H-GB4 TaxID=3069755 RepID=UPI0027B73900|nr:winged helix-turn-helix domain-containing protein [Haloarcula sp. H-GB4]MDQ2074751.1 winged helix-turn-helix domain-containing protein [Haloarcula sp. H-GB4]